MANNMIDQVKKIPIPSYVYNIVIPQMAGYYNDYTVDFDSDPRCKCCLHDENTPSMRWYEETNTFFCWGCRKGGDIIKLHMEFTARMIGTMPSFKESVNFLYNYFILRKETAQVVIEKVEEQEKLSTVTEISRYSNYKNRLYNQLIADDFLTEDKKDIIFRAINETEILVELNKVNATESMDYLKDIVRKCTI